MPKLETGILGKFWNVVLQRFNSSNKTLLNLNFAVGILESLVNFVQLQRNKFEEFEEAGNIWRGQMRMNNVEFVAGTYVWIAWLR